MFIADCLVGNFDRHNGNWGFLINENLKKIEIAPIYDCGSCLYPQLDDEKINYYEYISGLKNEECNEALIRMFSKIDIEKINEIVDATPYISNIRKEFYKK